jgi:hypothetical protein
MADSSFSFFSRSAAVAACVFRAEAESSTGDGEPFEPEFSECTEDAEEPEPFALPLIVALIVVPLLCLSLSFFSLSVPLATSSRYLASSSSSLLCAKTCQITPRMACGIPVAIALFSSSALLRATAAGPS